MATIHISPEATEDMRGIKEYITMELETPSAAVNTVSKITKAIRGLSSFPGIGAPLSSIVDVQTDYRYLVSGSYLVVYRYEQDDVYIIRVLYGRRDYMKILFGEPAEDEN